MFVSQPVNLHVSCPCCGRNMPARDLPDGFRRALAEHSLNLLEAGFRRALGEPPVASRRIRVNGAPRRERRR